MESSNSSTVASKSVNVVIISSYCYDDPMTDMNCAWYTVYTIYEVDSRTIRTVKCGTGWGQTLEQDAPELNIIDITDEIKYDYMKKLEEDRQAAAQAMYERCKKEVDAYNEKLLPNNVGQIVEIMEGRSKGIIGKVTWFGKNKFGYSHKPSYYSVSAGALLQWASCKAYTIPHENDDLICIRPLGYHTTFENGKEKIYIDPAKCQVLEGYTPVEITLESCYNFDRWHNDNFSEKWHMGYNQVSNI